VPLQNNNTITTVSKASKHGDRFKGATATEFTVEDQFLSKCP